MRLDLMGLFYWGRSLEPLALGLELGSRFAATLPPLTRSPSPLKRGGWVPLAASPQFVIKMRRFQILCAATIPSVTSITSGTFYSATVTGFFFWAS